MINRICKRAAGVILLALTLVFMLGATAFAQETAPSLVAPPAGSPVILYIVYAILSLVGMLGVAWMKGRIDRSDKADDEKKAEKDAVDSLWNGAASTYLAYVQTAKVDGNFDQKEARRRAVAAGKKMAGPAAKALYELWGDDKLDALVHRFANRQGADRASEKPVKAEAPAEVAE